MQEEEEEEELKPVATTAVCYQQEVGVNANSACVRICDQRQLLLLLPLIRRRREKGRGLLISQTLRLPHALSQPASQPARQPASRHPCPHHSKHYFLSSHHKQKSRTVPRATS